MIWQPRNGQRVELHYRKDMRVICPYHLARGVIVAAANGKGPRNAAVKLDNGRMICVPRGNMVELKHEQMRMF